MEPCFCVLSMIIWFSRELNYILNENRKFKIINRQFQERVNTHIVNGHIGILFLNWNLNFPILVFDYPRYKKPLENTSVVN